MSDRHGVEDVVVLWRLDPDKAARFDLSAYFDEIIIDLLGKDGRLTIRPFSGSYSAEIERRSEALRDLDWSEVVTLPTGSPIDSNDCLAGANCRPQAKRWM